jgi:ParB-like chromosome segregation protein Spo0J
MAAKKAPAVHTAHDEMVAVENVKENPRNPNRHPDAQLELLAHIIKEQGWRAPITVSKRSGYVVRGHGRLQAAKLLGLKQVPVDWQDYPSDEAELADLLADNRVAELAEMDALLRAELLSELAAGDFDALLTGYDPQELEALLLLDADLDVSSLTAEKFNEVAKEFHEAEGDGPPQHEGRWLYVEFDPPELARLYYWLRDTFGTGTKHYLDAQLLAQHLQVPADYASPLDEE